MKKSPFFKQCNLTHLFGVNLRVQSELTNDILSTNIS